MPISALEYHDVIGDGVDWHASGFPGNSAASYKMDAQRFAAHLAAVAQLPNNAGGDVRLIDVATRDRVVLFTFDDGGDSAIPQPWPTCSMRAAGAAIS